MTAILVDAVLFFLLLALISYGTWQLLAGSAVGVRARQVRNRKRIEQASALTCPLHGPHSREELVRLPSGDTICPQCYLEIQDADFR